MLDEAVGGLDSEASLISNVMIEEPMLEEVSNSSAALPRGLPLRRVVPGEVRNKLDFV